MQTVSACPLRLQGWLQTQNSGGSPGASQLVATQRSGRSGTLSGPPPTVPEVDEFAYGEHTILQKLRSYIGVPDPWRVLVSGC